MGGRGQPQTLVLPTVVTRRAANPSKRRRENPPRRYATLSLQGVLQPGRRGEPQPGSPGSPS